MYVYVVVNHRYVKLIDHRAKYNGFGKFIQEVDNSALGKDFHRLSK